MIKRRFSKQIQIGDVKIGGDAPISVQSMCNTDTRDVEKTVSQIKALTDAGCELVRLAVLNKDAAAAIKEIKKRVEVPLIADIHFDYRLAIQCIENGIDALRLNPGNIGRDENVKKVVDLAKTNNVPIRIGINAGSLEKNIAALDIPLSEKMVMSAFNIENPAYTSSTGFSVNETLIVSPIPSARSVPSPTDDLTKPPFKVPASVTPR